MYSLYALTSAQCCHYLWGIHTQSLSSCYLYIKRFFRLCLSFFSILSFTTLNSFMLPLLYSFQLSNNESVPRELYCWMAFSLIIYWLFTLEESQISLFLNAWCPYKLHKAFKRVLRNILSYVLYFFLYFLPVYVLKPSPNPLENLHFTINLFFYSLNKIVLCDCYAEFPYFECFF